MKKHEIKVGGHYVAKVGANITTVRVDAIRQSQSYRASSPNTATTLYDVTNLKTGRKTTFRSAMKFRGVALDSPTIPAAQRQLLGTTPQSPEAEQRPDPILTGPTSPPAMTPATTSGLSAKLAPKPVDNSPHLIVQARAGTGKTTTLVEGLRGVLGGSSHLTPSPQQAAVWEAMGLSKGLARSIRFTAFNRSIAEELQQRVPAGCEAGTMHSMGCAAVTSAYGRMEASKWTILDLVCEQLGGDFKDLKKSQMGLISACEDLVELCKMNLAHPWEPGWDEKAYGIIGHHGIEMPDDEERVLEIAKTVLEKSRSPKRKISFSDMIWLPLVNNLTLPRYDLLLVDEAQDLNRAQQELAKRVGKRLILCGDSKQAIYGFAGADSEAMPRLARELNDDPVNPPMSQRGCQLLPLTVTRRCGKAIVAEAQRYCPDFEAHESNPEGRVLRAKLNGKGSQGEDYAAKVQTGDFILCRTNAPLVQQCFRFLRQGRKANIQGRDIGKGLMDLGKKCSKDWSASLADMIGNLGDWLDKEQAKETAKKNPSESKLDALQDRHDCLLAFSEDASTPRDVERKINDVFTDDRSNPGIKLSSIHKAKGLESRRVFFLQPKGGPRRGKMQEWELEQEDNLRYVAITRAIEELTYAIEG